MSKTEENLIQLTQAFDTGPIYLSPAHFNFRTLDTIERHDKHNETRIRVRLDPAESVAGEPVRGYRSYFVREAPEEVLRLLTVACGEGVTAVSVATEGFANLTNHVRPHFTCCVYHSPGAKTVADQKPVFADEASPTRTQPAFADFVQTVDGVKRPIRLDLVNDKVVRVLQALDRDETIMIVLENDVALRVDGRFDEVCEKIYGRGVAPTEEEARREFSREQLKTLQTRIKQQRKQLRALNQSIRDLNAAIARGFAYWSAARKQLDDAKKQIATLVETRTRLLNLCGDARQALQRHGVRGGLVEALAAEESKEHKDV